MPKETIIQTFKSNGSLPSISRRIEGSRAALSSAFRLEQKWLVGNNGSCSTLLKAKMIWSGCEIFEED